MVLPLRPGDRVAVRDRPWRVQGVQEVGPGQLLLKLLRADGPGGTASLLTPPERVLQLPPEELLDRHRAERVLVVVPPGLIPQWEEELVERFGLAFTVIENAAGLARVQTTLPAGLSPWELPRARIITSMDYVKKDEVRRRALGRSLAHRLEALRKGSQREEPPERSELGQCHALRPVPARHAERGAGRILRWSSARERERRGCRGRVPPARSRPPRPTGGCTSAGRPVPIIGTVEP